MGYTEMHSADGDHDKAGTMTDYGHDLLFGTFITPVAQPALHAVDLALVAERAGLDLVTFQDHPYQPAFLDTWTLLTYVAARTTTIHVSANVLNLPLRHPAVIARSVASLDRLSGGRVELGIGAGGFWDAIAAMGGRRLTPGQSIVALEEAITIIRAIWATDTRGGVRVTGTYYQVTGTKRGPTPAHTIGIWVGAYKPRILNLTGRVADGWLPSLGYLPDGLRSLADMNRCIDAGAAAAGRGPADVRRLLNIAGQFMPFGRGCSMDRRNNGPTTWRTSRSTMASAASFWEPMMPQRSSGSPPTSFRAHANSSLPHAHKPAAARQSTAVLPHWQHGGHAVTCRISLRRS